MLTVYRYRLFTRKAEEENLTFLLSQARYVYNKGLELRRDAYEADKTSLSYANQWAHFRDERKGEPERLGKLNATCLQQTLRRLDKSFKAFFRRVKAAETPGYPRFKGANRFHSLDFVHGDGCKVKEVKGRTVLYVQNVGNIKVKLHRPLPKGKIKRVSVKRSNGKWYANITLELPDPKPVCEKTAVGIDVGLKSLMTLSTGEHSDNPRWFRATQAKLRRQQRHLMRCKKGTNVRRKAAQQVAKTHEKIKNQRKDVWHKATRKLVDRFDVFVIEDLNLSFMLKNKHLSKSAADAGLGIGFETLISKAESAGKRVIKVDPKNTSQACSGCGVIPKSLSVRTHTCPDCGLSLDRDVNAALNILSRGHRLAASWDSSPSVLAEAALL